METILITLHKKLNNIRSTNATPTMIDNVLVELSDCKRRLNTIATVSSVDAYTLAISPYVKMYAKSIEKAIYKSNLGVTPSMNGDVIHIRFPVLTRDRREELVKLVKASGEEAKIAARQLRKKLNDDVKASDDSDDHKKVVKKLNQHRIDSIISIIDDDTSRKRAELLKV